MFRCALCAKQLQRCNCSNLYNHDAILHKKKPSLWWVLLHFFLNLFSKHTVCCCWFAQQTCGNRIYYLNSSDQSNSLVLLTTVLRETRKSTILVLCTHAQCARRRNPIFESASNTKKFGFRVWPGMDLFFFCCCEYSIRACLWPL